MPWPFRPVFWLAFVGLAVRAWSNLVSSWRYATFPEESEGGDQSSPAPRPFTVCRR